MGPFLSTGTRGRRPPAFPSIHPPPLETPRSTEAELRIPDSRGRDRRGIGGEAADCGAVGSSRGAVGLPAERATAEREE
jgi:hypothetical protein